MSQWGQQPPQGYGQGQPQGYPQQGQPQGYPQQGYGPPVPPPKKGLSAVAIALIVVGAVVGLAAIALVLVVVMGATKPEARDVCARLERAGIARGCHQVKPEVINARAKEKYDFDLVSVPGHKGAVLSFASAEDYEATVDAYAAAAMLAGPHRYGSESARIFVQLNTNASLDVGNKTKALIDSL